MTATRPEVRQRKSSSARYEAERRALMARGEWQPFVPAGPVRDHVRQVMAATGLSYGQVAAVAGVSRPTVRNLLAGAYPRVKAGVAGKLGQVTVGAPVPPGWASPAGSMRRLQALAWAGWPARELAGRLAMAPVAVRRIRDEGREKVRVSTAARIRAVYDELWCAAPPAATAAQKIAVTKARALARRQGWVPAGAWDEDAIDDPDGQPAEGWQRSERLTRDEAAAEARDLAALGVGRDEIRERLGMTANAVTRALGKPGDGEAA